MAIGSIAKVGRSALGGASKFGGRAKKFGSGLLKKGKKAFGRNRRGLSSGRGGSFGASARRGANKARKGFGRAAGRAGGKFNQLSEKQKKFLFASGILGGAGAGAGALSGRKSTSSRIGRLNAGKGKRLASNLKKRGIKFTGGPR